MYKVITLFSIYIYFPHFPVGNYIKLKSPNKICSLVALKKYYCCLPNKNKNDILKKIKTFSVNS